MLIQASRICLRIVSIVGVTRYGFMQFIHDYDLSTGISDILASVITLVSEVQCRYQNGDAFKSDRLGVCSR